MAASAALRTSLDTSGSPRANSSDTDFGAQNVTSKPATVGTDLRAGEPAPARRVDVGEHAAPAPRRRPRLSGRDGRAPAPIHWPGASLAGGVVLLGAPGDGVEVVRLLALGQLPEAQHGPTAQRTADRTIRHSTAGASASTFLGLVSAGRAGVRARRSVSP